MKNLAPGVFVAFRMTIIRMMDLYRGKTFLILKEIIIDQSKQVLHLQERLLNSILLNFNLSSMYSFAQLYRSHCALLFNLAKVNF